MHPLHHLRKDVRRSRQQSAATPQVESIERLTCECYTGRLAQLQTLK